MSSNASQPVVVLIPGAWHTDFCYSLLIPHLEAYGLECAPITLPSVGAEPPVTSLNPDILHIQSALWPFLEHDREVTVVMHSYAGVPGSSALRGLDRASRHSRGLPGGVTALVYLCAYMIPEGMSIISSGGGGGGKGGVQTDAEGRMVHLNPINAFYHDLPQDLAEKYASRLQHHSAATLQQPVAYSSYNDISTTYMQCENDRVISFARQVKMVEAAGSYIKTITCDSGHSPFLSHVELTARVVHDAIISQGTYRDNLK